MTPDDHLRILKDRGLLKDIVNTALSKGYNTDLIGSVFKIYGMSNSYEIDMSRSEVIVRRLKPTLYEKTYSNEAEEDGVEGVVRASIDIIRALLTK